MSGRADVFSLPAFGSLGHFKLYGLAFLQASETAGLNGREMDEYIFAGLAADKAIAFGVIEPLYCALFHIVVLLFLCCSYAGGSRKKNWRRLLAVEARTAYDRFGLTHDASVPGLLSLGNEEVMLQSVPRFSTCKSAVSAGVVIYLSQLHIPPLRYRQRSLVQLISARGGRPSR